MSEHMSLADVTAESLLCIQEAQAVQGALDAAAATRRRMEALESARDDVVNAAVAVWATDDKDEQDLAVMRLRDVVSRMQAVGR